MQVVLHDKGADGGNVMDEAGVKERCYIPDDFSRTVDTSIWWPIEDPVHITC